MPKGASPQPDGECPVDEGGASIEDCDEDDDPLIAEIRAIRRRISEQFGNDPVRLVMEYHIRSDLRIGWSPGAICFAKRMSSLPPEATALDRWRSRERRR